MCGPGGSQGPPGMTGAGPVPYVNMSGPHKNRDPAELWDKATWLVLWVHQQEGWGWTLCSAPLSGARLCHMWLCCGWPGLMYAWATGWFWADSRSAPCLSSCLVTRYEGQCLSHCLLQTEKATQEAFIQVWEQQKLLWSGGTCLLENKHSQLPVTKERDEFTLQTLLEKP